MALNWPPHEFVQGTNNLVLFIEGHSISSSIPSALLLVDKRRHISSALIRIRMLLCKASAHAAIIDEDDSENERFILCKYMNQHVASCIPSNLVLQVKKIKDTIKKRIHESPSIKPSLVYNEEFNQIRDNLTQEQRTAKQSTQWLSK